jgi:transposase
MEMPLAEIRIKCVSLVYRHGLSYEEISEQANKVFKWVMESQGQSETTPQKRGRKPKAKLDP